VIVVSASGSAFPIAIMVKPKYVLDKFVIIPTKFNRSIRIPEAKYVHIIAENIVNTYIKI